MDFNSYIFEVWDIYKPDEFGLFYQQLPTKTFHLKGEQSAGGKFRKVCLTSLAAGNEVGKKLAMLIIRMAE